MLRWFSRSSSSSSPQMSLGSSLFLILGSTLLISGSAACLVWFWPTASSTPITVLIHGTPSTHERLPGHFLAAWMGLSQRPIPFVRFDALAAEKQLAERPMIKHVHVRKVRPDAVCVDYTLRHPIAMLGNLHNTAIDQEGVLIPCYPYFSQMPHFIVYFPEEWIEGKWGSSLSPKAFDLLHAFLDAWNRLQFSDTSLVHLDLAGYDYPSAGRRQIVLSLQEKKVGKKIDLLVRLPCEGFSDQLSLYKSLIPYLDNSAIIDLRFPSLALLTNI